MGAIFILDRHEFICQKLDLILVFLVKFILTKTDLSIYDTTSHILAVKLRCCQHLIELPILIFCRFYFDLIGAVCKIGFTKQTVDLMRMAFSSIDVTMYGRNDIFPKALIDNIALLLKFAFILRFIICLILIQQIHICIIALLCATEAYRRIFSVKAVSCSLSVLQLLLLLLFKLCDFSVLLTLDSLT